MPRALGVASVVLLALAMPSACDPEPPLPATAVDAVDLAIPYDNCVDTYQTPATVFACKQRVWQSCEERYHPCPTRPPRLFIVK